MVNRASTDQPSDVRTNKVCDAEFWCSKYAALSLLASLFLIVLSISFLIPPFQSPDEFVHFDRAYLLSKGDAFLNSKGNVSGGYIDTGLMTFMNLFHAIPFRYENKIDNRGRGVSQQIRWSGKKQFIALPVVYGPLLYIPQALAVIVGEASGMTVSNTYYLARFFSLTVTLTLLGCALLLYPAPLILIAVFIIPMSLFQMGSSSMDSVSFAICVLAASLYKRGCDNDFSFNQFMLYALSVCVLALAISRWYLFPLTLLPAFLYINHRSYSYILHSAIAGVLALAWIGYAITTYQSKLLVREVSTPSIVFYYLTNPLRLFNVLYTTFTDKTSITGYWHMFVGVLGWLDTPLGSYVYVLYAVLLCIFAGISFQRTTTCLAKGRNVILFCVAIASGLLLFIMYILAETPHPATVVQGVQGRHFTTVVILLCYAIFDRRLSRNEFKLGVIIIFAMLCLSIAGMSPTLLDRYWVGGGFQNSSNPQIDFNADAYYNRGVAHGKVRNYMQAISDFDRAIEIDPEYSAAYYNRSLAYGKLGNYKQAIADCDRAIGINPEYADAYYTRGLAYSKLGNYTQAISDFDRAIGINPEYADAYHNRGLADGKLGEHWQAISDFDRAIEINPEYAEAYYGRGLAYGKLGEYRQAISNFDRAIEINPEYAAAYYNRAVVYGLLGEHSKEIEDLKKAGSLDAQDAKKR